MKLRVILLALALWPALAHASFLAPTCTDNTPAQRLAQADIAGTGEITAVECDCAATRPGCTYTVALHDLQKDGGSGATVKYHDIWMLDYGLDARECARLTQSARTAIGKTEPMYFRRTDDGLEPIGPKSCKYP